MKQIELRLIPQPGAKPEFLAKLEPSDGGSAADEGSAPVQTLWAGLPPLIVLEAYTRDTWASDAVCKWTSVRLKSVDGRNKLPGFVDYLGQRKKNAFGACRHLQTKQKYAIVVPHKQASSTQISVRFAPISTIPDCPIKDSSSASTSSTKQQEKKQSPAPEAAVPSSQPKPKSTATTTRKKKGFGLLGNLVAGQQRTNVHLQSAAVTKKASTTSSAPPPQQQEQSQAEVSSHQQQSSVNGNASTEVSNELKPAGKVLMEFRDEMEQKMLDFDIAPDVCLKVEIDVAGKVKQTIEEEQSRMTLDALKFIVYEAAEEVNEEWVAYREPSEFLDEVTIAIYKEGEAPPEVLEDMNSAELPDEVRGQQRAIQQERQRQEQLKAAKQDKSIQKEALKHVEEEDDFAALNQNKRDRRTLEEYEMAKRQRTE